jgi:uncharacterized protein YpmS
MNKWKMAFILLFSVVILTIASVVFYITRPIDDTPTRTISEIPEGSHFQVNTTADDFENLANQLISNSMKGSKIPVKMYVDDQVTLSGTLPVFDMDLPIVMTFDPTIVNGNLLLKQKTIEVGMLDIPPATALKLLKDSVEMPNWMVIQPKEEQIYINLTEKIIPLGDNLKGRLQAKEFNLEENRIILDVVIPKK